MDKNQELSKLKNSILKFNKNFPGKNLVFSDGNIDAKVMIIGEAPGRTEDKLQKPFVGRAGKLLDSLLESIHLDRSKVYITNVVNYRPDKNRKPTPEEINEFKKILFKHIEIIKPKCLLLLGATAATAVLNHKGPLSELRGKFKNIKIMNSYFDVLTTFHPAFLLRNPKKKINFIKDIIKIIDKI
ncbi:MAG: uracil-DNA glycosylase [Alphaproteobacteria bacterium]|nr:uracil-DNA glycosylase [Candidatus Fonsibacter sp. PEL55]